MSTSSARRASASSTMSLLPAAASMRTRLNCIPTGPKARRSFGLFLLGIVVFLWVSSNFLTHAIFADDSYSKPYLVTYLNTATFMLYLVPEAGRWALQRQRRGGYDRVAAEEEEEEDVSKPANAAEEQPLTFRETLRLSLEFCLLWFLANYFSSYSLKFTTVASSTILCSTSSMFTLLLGSVLKVEHFTPLKLLSVLVSLLGIALVSLSDSSTPAKPENLRTPAQILIGDTLALCSALLYALYILLLKLRIHSESRVNMRHFFGFVGLFNTLLLWPGLLLLNATSAEKFELPQDARIWAIIAVNASITLVSDFCWAYAMLLTSPLVTTLGLSLTIPLALAGEVVMGVGTGLGVWYWVGAGCVVGAFWVGNREEREDERRE